MGSTSAELYFSISFAFAVRHGVLSAHLSQIIKTAILRNGRGGRLTECHVGRYSDGPFCAYFPDGHKC